MAVYPADYLGEEEGCRRRGRGEREKRNEGTKGVEDRERYIEKNAFWMDASN